MPLEPGKSQKVISRNIAVERHHGRPEKQAIAIAESNARRTGDSRADEVAAEAARIFKSSGKQAANAYILKETQGEAAWVARAVADKVLNILVPESGREGRMKRLEIMRTGHVSDDIQPVGLGRAMALRRHEEGVTKSQDKRTKDMKKSRDVMPVGVTPPLTLRPATLAVSLDRKRARDIMGNEVREALGIPEELWKNLSAEEKRAKAREAVEKRGKVSDRPRRVGDVGRFSDMSDQWLRKTIAQLRRETEAHKQKNLGSERSEADKKYWQKFIANSERVIKEQEQELASRKTSAKDTELPVPIKTSNLVPMPSGENNEVSYAPRRAKDRGRFVKVGDTQHFGSEPKDHMTRAVQYEIQGDRARALDSYRAAASGFRRTGDRANEARARDGVEACQTKFAQQYDHPGKGRVKVCDSAESAVRTALERTRAGEAVAVDGVRVMPRRMRAADEDPILLEGESDATLLANYLREDGGESSPYFEALEQRGQPVKAVIGDDTSGVFQKAEYKGWSIDKNPRGVIVASKRGQTPFAARSTEHAKVVIDRRDSDPGERHRMGDEHLGFKKLESKLAHEKGVSDPAAVAASIGRKKYGAEGMARKATAGRARDDRAELAASNWTPFVESLKARVDQARDARRRRMYQEEYDAAKRALEGLRNSKDERSFNMWADALRYAKRKATDKEVQPV